MGRVLIDHQSLNAYLLMIASDRSGSLTGKNGKVIEKLPMLESILPAEYRKTEILCGWPRVVEGWASMRERERE